MIFKRWLVISKNVDDIYNDSYYFTEFGATMNYSDILNTADTTAVYLYHYEGGVWEYVKGWCAD